MTTDNLKQWQQVEPKFELGNVAITRGAFAAVNHDDVYKALHRHHRGDWGLVCADDWTLNDEDLNAGGRLVSRYDDSVGKTFWIITEADRSSTTILLPEEY